MRVRIRSFTLALIRQGVLYVFAYTLMDGEAPNLLSEL